MSDSGSEEEIGHTGGVTKQEFEEVENNKEKIKK